MDVQHRIQQHRDILTRAERRVADAVLTRPQSVAFGTVADLARLTQTSGATVIRFANKLGFDGYLGLQNRIQDELSAKLRPAAERIRQPAADNVMAQVLANELSNVESTLSGMDRGAFATAVEWLAELDRAVHLCPGDCARGVADLAADQLLSLRPGVGLVEGNQVRVGRQLALIEPGDVVVVVDFQRYDRWTLTSAGVARERGAKIITMTDSRFGPLAGLADVVLIVSAVGAGPFDSQVGTLALFNALVTGVADALRPAATGRLERVERTWQAMAALTTGDDGAR